MQLPGEAPACFYLGLPFLDQCQTETLQSQRCVCIVSPEYLYHPSFKLQLSVTKPSLYLNCGGTRRPDSKVMQWEAWTMRMKKGKQQQKFSLSQCMELQIRMGVKTDLSRMQAKSFEVWRGIDLFVSQESTNTFLTK